MFLTFTCAMLDHEPASVSLFLPLATHLARLSISLASFIALISVAILIRRFKLLQFGLLVLLILTRNAICRGIDLVHLACLIRIILDTQP